jgi:hypothetical protein
MTPGWPRMGSCSEGGYLIWKLARAQIKEHIDLIEIIQKDLKT